MEVSDIKAWLKKTGHNRTWLGEQCGVSKSTVNGWLSAQRPIPNPALKILTRLMTGEVSLNPNLPLETFLKAQRLANEQGVSLDAWIAQLIEREVAKKG